MKMFRGDLRPDLRLTLTSDGKPVDLTLATSIRIIGVRDAIDGPKAFDRTVSGNAAGEVVMAWQSGDTDRTGRILLEVQVTWPGQRPQTFRSTGFVDIAQRLA